MGKITIRTCHSRKIIKVFSLFLKFCVCMYVSLCVCVGGCVHVHVHLFFLLLLEGDFNTF